MDSFRNSLQLVLRLLHLCATTGPLCVVAFVLSLERQPLRCSAWEEYCQPTWQIPRAPWWPTKMVLVVLTICPLVVKATSSISRRHHPLPLSVSVPCAVLALLMGLTTLDRIFRTVELPTRHSSLYPLPQIHDVPYKRQQTTNIHPEFVRHARIAYESWASGISAEPMVSHRDFFVDRFSISNIGNFSAASIEVERNITCQPASLITLGTRKVGKGDWQTSIKSQRGAPVWMRMQPALGVWIDDHGEEGTSGAWATMIFCNLNGSLEGGMALAPNWRMSMEGIRTASALSCHVTTRLRDSTLSVGQGQYSPRPTLSSLEMIGSTIPTPAGRRSALNNLAIWLSVASSTYGFSIHGAQPMFSKSSQPSQKDALQLPLAYSSQTSGSAAASWTQEELRNFISIGSGALITSLSSGRASQEPQYVQIESSHSAGRL